MYTLHHKKV